MGDSRSISGYNSVESDDSNPIVEEALTPQAPFFGEPVQEHGANNSQGHSSYVGPLREAHCSETGQLLDFFPQEFHFTVRPYRCRPTTATRRTRR